MTRLALPLRVLLTVVGVILLLPGLCSVLLMITAAASMLSGNPGIPGELAMLGVLWAVCFLVSWGGWVMIRRAFRGGRASVEDDRPTGEA